MGPHKHFRNDRAFTLLEVTIALGVSILILYFMQAGIRMSVTLKKRIEHELAVRDVEEALSARVALTLEAQDSYPFSLAPIVQNPGAIRFFDGSLNPVMSDREALRPAPDARAVTVVDPEFRQALAVQQMVPSTLACLLHGEAGDFEDFRTALVISADGMWEAGFKATKHSGRPDCFDVRLMPVRSMSLPTPSPIALATVRLIIPITEEYTLYQSRNGDLHYLGHAGGDNLENQPIAQGLSKFTATVSTIMPPNLISFGLSAYVQGKFVHKEGLSRFAKLDYLSVLLNAF